ncbi:BRCA1-associated protein [Coprinopsis cinerea okayama7|uniref:BRCA1-associated protein n=1 Tax=Coprinopsis cinerea (strain Okayama-7 / 130 / ATCC MYA-4618 / FGSC 9003) TaxID=240176 RepID=A8N996_COPC7|nr:BRCA1-associated protein [Coprinopsis cinerea okayama7\|eukprot:XP_001831424.2 BRCA1-associated protein [Coprinopsis cinerea okayama7\
MSTSSGYHIRLVLSPGKDTSSEDQFVPASLFQHLPDHQTLPVEPRNPGPSANTSSDYRLGRVSVDWMDFEQTASSSSSVSRERQFGRGPRPAEGTFVPVTRHKSGTTNLPEGVVHIFREVENKLPLEELEAKTNALHLDTEPPPEEDGVMLAVLAVPSWMTPSDFLTFVGPVAEDLAHLRIIRDYAPNRSIALLKFVSAAIASEFAAEYNGKPFNSMEPEICHVVHVLSVVVDVEDPVLQAIPSPSASQSSVYELPTCPVCLERMDAAVTGLITVPCSHTFHCMCLSKWGDSRCPVCRYSQTLIASHPSTSSNRSRSVPFSTPSPSMARCMRCMSTTNLWICLICGNVGCGRYGQAHAHAHYQETTHLYALELETQRVWDYAGDGYVHRLIQNKTDGKLVELPSASASVGTTARDHNGLGPSQADALTAEKIEAIGIEYSYLLTSQLESQREYYENQASELKEQLVDLKALVARLSLDFESERSRAREEEGRRRAEEEEKLSQALKDKAKAEQRADKALELARKFEKELKEEKAVSEGLMKNLVVMKERVEQFDRDKEAYTKKVKELEDQVRDVMFFLEARTKIEQGEGVEGEAAGGSLEIAVPPETPTTANGKKKKQKKGR